MRTVDAECCSSSDSGCPQAVSLESCGKCDQERFELGGDRVAREQGGERSGLAATQDDGPPVAQRLFKYQREIAAGAGAARIASCQVAQLCEGLTRERTASTVQIDRDRVHHQEGAIAYY